MNLETLYFLHISTHSLTRRLTAERVLKAYEVYISTHSLTRRLTHRILADRNLEQHFNSQPHKEADGRRCTDI